jgi:hypothetical protein
MVEVTYSKIDWVSVSGYCSTWSSVKEFGHLVSDLDRHHEVFVERLVVMITGHHIKFYGHVSREALIAKPFSQIVFVLS